MSTLKHDTKNDTRAKDLAKLVASLGAQSAKSALAKPQLAIATVRAAFDGVIGEDDVPDIFEQYIKGRASEIAKNRLASGDKEDNANSIKANKSKLLQLCKLGLLPGIDGPALLDKVTDRREQLMAGDVMVKPTFDAFVDVARAQIRTPQVPLADDDIDKVVSKPEKAEKELVEKLCGAYKSMYNLAAKAGDEGVDGGTIATMQEAYEKIADAIKSLDGDVPAMTKEAKAEQAAMQYLSKQGFKFIKNPANVTPEATA